MEVVLLGTGAADGWPNPFCTCASCADAARRGEIRGQTAALVDDVLMLDCGPEAPRAAVRHGRSLAQVRHILLTHAHADHLGPQALLFRSWVAAGVELDVIGPADALDTCRPWVAPDAPVRFVPVEPGDSLTVGDYSVRVLPARHKVFRDGDAVLYDLSGPGGSRLLWACDTGMWLAEWFEAVRDARFDAVFLEETFGDRSELSEGHLGLPEFGAMVDGLRGVGAVTENTEVVAVHLGHHNPPIDELRNRLQQVDARPGRDGEVVHVGEGTPVVPHRTLVLGGVRSGKSRHAEELLASCPSVTYVATGGTREGDAEWAERVALHRERRPGSWSTVETVDVAEVLCTATEPLLIDCLGTWLTARLDIHGVWDGGDLDPVHSDVDELIAAWRKCAVPVVAVSNEVGSGVVPATSSGRLFRDMLGRLNARVAEASEAATLVVAGIPVSLKRN
ncbi:bifunctional adenosylcobinamide kinase/adenosylcobinamide-phosphate guanylyltransferase [Rhodococcus sp. D-6]|uniref:Adenosylcobinamide kinase n=1 Tax=Rhodococcus sp. D-6 TaxID=1387842 RepID=A0AAU7US77_9NOCA|nr:MULTISPECIES: bifunctional adenosylcobinamide kinase/adenosylcobinamide-phosphate guanylyltransferase [unclassified Rhodococcus (in: high G+C Gram-positive bacteria)]BDB62093.1 adenosylcobinamide kinase/adenosylcobinamide phosphate guanyltransferase [Rhodococcus sp. RDE2]